MTLEAVRVPEDEGVVDVTGVSDGDGEDGGVALLNVSHAVRGVKVDAVHHVHQGQRDEVVLNGRVLVRLSRDTNLCEFVAVGLVNRRCLDTHVEANVLAAFQENWGVREDARVVGGEVEVRGPVHRHAGDVEAVGVSHEILWTGRGVVHRHVVDGLLTGFNHVIERLAFVKLNVDLTGQHVGITDGEPVVVTFVAARVGVGPRDVRAASQVVGERWRHTNGRLPTAVRPEFVGVPRRDRHRFPRVESRQTITGQVGLVQAGVENFFVGREVARVNPCDVDVVLVVG